MYKSMIIGKKVVLPEYMFLAWLTRAIVLPLVLVTVVIDGIKFIVDNLADPLIGLILHLDYLSRGYVKRDNRYIQRGSINA